MKNRIGSTILMLVFGFWSASLAQEQLTITTYYPSPSGSYNQLSSSGNTYLATDSASFFGVGTSSPLGKFTLQADSTTGIDRANQLVIQGRTNPNYKFNFGIHTEASPAYADIGFTEESSAWRDIVLAKNGGNVGIGTIPAAGYKLDVSGAIRSPMWKVTQLLNSTPGPLPLGSAAFTTGGGTLLIFASGSGSAAAVQAIGMNIQVDGVNRGQARLFTDLVVNSHKSFVANPLVVTGVAAGSHNISLVPLAGTVTDANDVFYVTVLELPF